MEWRHLSGIEEREVAPGFHARFVHSESVTIAYWRIDAASTLPAHAHVHEQVVNVLEGEFELTVGDETRRLGPGAVVIIPSNVRHGGRALTSCRLIDVFHPVRADYR